LIVGNIDGDVYLVPNDGTRTEPKFGAKLRLAHGDGGDAAPTVADWDGDGLPDLLVGDGSGQVRLFRATGRDDHGRPMLAAARVLVPASQSMPFGQQSKDRPWG